MCLFILREPTEYILLFNNELQYKLTYVGSFMKKKIKQAEDSCTKTITNFPVSFWMTTILNGQAKETSKGVNVISINTSLICTPVLDFFIFFRACGCSFAQPQGSTDLYCRPVRENGC